MGKKSIILFGYSQEQKLGDQMDWPLTLRKVSNMEVGGPHHPAVWLPVIEWKERKKLCKESLDSKVEINLFLGGDVCNFSVIGSKRSSSPVALQNQKTKSIRHNCRFGEDDSRHHPFLSSILADLLFWPFNSLWLPHPATKDSLRQVVAAGPTDHDHPVLERRTLKCAGIRPAVIGLHRWTLAGSLRSGGCLLFNMWLFMWGENHSS